MQREPAQSILRSIRKLAAAAGVQRLTDCQLLQRYAVERDELAFEALLQRHGAMVLRVCRAVLREAHAAEDAFQATFLILVRKADAIARPERLGNWLYGVAYRVALRARQTLSRHEGPEVPEAAAAAADPANDAASREMQDFLHEELERLPAEYRSSMVLCYLEGRTNEEAARQLRWPVGTLKVRLLRGRALLRARLARRGVALGAAALAATLSPGGASALPAPLLDTTMNAALLFTAGNAAKGVALSARVVALTEGVLKTMTWNKFKIAAVLLVILGLLGAGWFAFHPLAAGPKTTRDPAPMARADADKTPAKPEEAADPERIKGVWSLVSLQRGDMKKTDEELKKFDGKLTISGDKIRLQLAGTMEDVAGTITLDAAKSPKHISWRFGGPDDVPEVGRGIYVLDKEKLTICLNHLGSPRPTEFKTKAGAPWPMLMAFQRSGQVDEHRLQGAWTVVAAKPEAAMRERVLFAADTMTAAVGGKKFAFTFKLDPFTKPAKIDLTELEGTHAGSIHLGIYELEGDNLKMCIASFGKRPTALTADPRLKQHEMVLKRAR